MPPRNTARKDPEFGLKIDELEAIVGYRFDRETFTNAWLGKRLGCDGPRLGRKRTGAETVTAPLSSVARAASE